MKTRKSMLSLLLLFYLWSLGWGCSGESGSNADAGEWVQDDAGTNDIGGGDMGNQDTGGGGQSIGPEGGTIETGEGVVLVIPAGALTQEVKITVQLEPVSGFIAPLGTQAYHLRPNGVTFDIPAKLTLPIPDTLLNVAATGNLELLLSQQTGNKWNMLEGISIDQGSKRITGSIGYLGQARVSGPWCDSTSMCTNEFSCFDCDHLVSGQAFWGECKPGAEEVCPL